MQDITERAKKIKVLILDVDGVLSDGRIYLDDRGGEYKAFYVHDGLGIKLLQQADITVAVITSRNSPIVAQRMENLGVKHVYQGCSDKVVALAELLDLLQLTPEQAAYVGDDLVDIPVLRKVGLSIAVANATATVKEYAFWHTKKKGGKGAVREVCEFLLIAQDKWQTTLAKYCD